MTPSTMQNRWLSQKWEQKEMDVDPGRPPKKEGPNYAEPQAFDGPVCTRPSPGPQHVWAPQWFFFFLSFIYCSKQNQWLLAGCLVPGILSFGRDIQGVANPCRPNS
jgi:hypothetical protein